MTFQRFSEYLSEIESVSARLEIIRLLSDLFRSLDARELPEAVLLLTGKVAPSFEGLEFGVAEREAAKALALVLGMEEKAVLSRVRESGDIGGLAMQLLPEREGTLSISEVYADLRALAEDSGVGSQQRKRERLGKLLESSSPLEARYILRIVTGKLRLGVGEATILEALAEAILGSRKKRPLLERAYNLTSDLAYVARLAPEGEEALRRVKVTVGKPVRMMLAERLPGASAIIEKLGPHLAEFKYDGERVQIHYDYDGERFWVFSRRTENITHQYPDLLEALAGVVDRSFILEAEAVVIDPESGEMRPFQYVLNRKVKHLTPELMARYPVKAFAFELLYLDGEPLVDLPYQTRRERLEAFLPSHDRFEIATGRFITTLDELEAFFEQALDSGCEGLMCKRLDAGYEAGKRGFKWVKFKGELGGRLPDTFDTVVVGAWWGRGRRSGTFGSLLVATYNPEADRFETVSKLGSGFTDEDLLSALPDRLLPHRVEAPSPRVRALLTPDVWFEPAVVVEVEAQEITLSPNHTCAYGVIKADRGLALRFPRFVRFRDDKSAAQATTSEEVAALYRQQWA